MGSQATWDVGQSTLNVLVKLSAAAAKRPGS